MSPLFALNDADDEVANVEIAFADPPVVVASQRLLVASRVKESDVARFVELVDSVLK